MTSSYLLKLTGLSILIFTLSLSCLRAQNIRGTVWDENHNGLSYATVRLLHPDSTFVAGVCTDSVGHYQIKASYTGNYLLGISSIGFKTKFIPVHVLQDGVRLEPVALDVETVRLGEVMVNASSFIRQKDHVLIIPEKTQVRHSASGYDLLYRLMIPEVEVDRINGKVSAIGGETTLYIDGRKADAREIRNLNPKDVEKIEYYDVPTGKYMNDISAINFVMKQHESGGYVSFNADQKIGYLSGDYNVVAKLSKKAMDYTLFAGFSQREYSKLTDDRQEAFVFTDRVVRRQSTLLDDRVKNNSQYAQLNISNKQDKRLLSGKLSLVHSDSPDNYNRRSLLYDGDKENIESFSNVSQSGWKPNLELYGHWNVTDKQYLETTVVGSYTHNQYRYSYQENDYTVLTDNQEDMYELYAILNYGIQFKHRNALTIQGFHFHTVSSIDYRIGNIPWQHFWEGESMLFLDYTQRFGKKIFLRVCPGFSYIQYRLHHDDRKSKLSPRLRFNVTYTFAPQQQIRLTCPVGSGFLDISQLNTVEQQIDSLQIRRGNPHQRVPFQTTPSIAYSGQFGKITVGANVAYDMINYMRYEDFSIENNKLVRSYNSDRKYRNFSVQLFGTWKVTDHLRMRLNGGWRYVTYPSTSKSLDNFWGNLQVDYYWKDLSYGLYAKSKTKWLNFNLMSVTMAAQCGGYVSWNPKNWRMEVGVTNPFSTKFKEKSMMDREIYRCQNSMLAKPDRFAGYVKLAYTFDFGKKTSRENNSVDRSINSAILKVE